MSRKLVIVDAFCTHAKGSDCTRCLEFCPKGAITLPEGEAPQVDHDLCTGCGICFGACDAFASTRITMPDLHERIRRIATQGMRVHITCKENIFPDFEPDNNVIVLPCIAMVPTELWTLMLAEDMRVSVCCDFRYCEDCERAGDLGGELFPVAIEAAQDLTGKEIRYSYRIPEKQKVLQKLTNDDDPTDRRAAFAGFAVDFGEIASGKRRLRNSEVLADYYQRKERARASARLNLAEHSVFDDFTPEGRIKHTMFPKQKMMLEAIERQHDIAEKLPVLVSTTAHEYCTLSGSCVDACPTGARQIEGDTVEVDPLYCIGCGICYDACAQGAVGLNEATGTIYLERIEAAASEIEPAKPERTKHVRNPFRRD